MKYSITAILFLSISGFVLAVEENPGESRRSPMVPTKKAIDLFEKRVESRPTDLSSRLVLGQLYMRRAKENDTFHDFISAEKQIQSVLAIQPKHESANLILSQALSAQHRFKEASEITKSLVKSKPNSAAALAILGDANMQLGKYEEAFSNYQTMISLTQSPGALARMARYHELKGELEQANALMNQAIESQAAAGDLAESTAWYHWRLGQMQFNTGNVNAAKKQLELAIECKPEYAESISMLAKIEAATGDKAKAVSLYEKALSIAEAPQTIIELGDLLTSMGQRDEANKHYVMVEAMFDEEAADPIAGPPHARERAIYFANHNKRLAHAVELAKNDLNMRSDIYAHDTAAWAYYKNEQYELAKQHIQKAMALNTPDANILYHAGLIEIASQNTKQGKQLLKKALALNPYFSIAGAKQIHSILTK